MRSGPRIISWTMIQEAGVSDQEYVALLHQVGSGAESWDDRLSAYKRFKEQLTTVDGVVIFVRRIVVPTSLRVDVLHALHRAHQGSSSMALRAGDTVWWPGISADLTRVRESCNSCLRNAPSLPALPPVELQLPDYPFQLVAGDYFDYGGKSYIVVVD